MQLLYFWMLLEVYINYYPGEDGEDIGKSL